MRYPAAMKKAREIASQAAGQELTFEEVSLYHRFQQPEGGAALAAVFTHPVFKEQWVCADPVLISLAEWEAYLDWSDKHLT